MNEKLKKTLKIAGIVGICALLFACGCGLGYCSAQKFGEPTKVLTERSRKNAQITTENGNFTGYTMTLPTAYPSTASTWQGYVYKVDQNFNLTQTGSYNGTITQQNIVSAVLPSIESLYDEGYQAQYYDRLSRYFVAYYANLEIDAPLFKYVTYLSFVTPQFNEQVTGVSKRSYTFIALGWTPYASIGLKQARLSLVQDVNALTFTDSKRDAFFVANSNPSTITMQDTESYYKEQGYNEGYDDGEIDGYGDGFEAGSGTGKMFTYLGVNQMRWYRTNLTADDQTDTSVTYRLLTFKDGQNASWSIYAINNISGTNLDNLKINLYQGTTANSANFRTTLGTGTETTLASGIWDVYPNDYSTFAFAQIIEVYNNSLVENYFLMDGIPENATGYQQGYQKGWSDGYNASPGGQSLDNVFSIFTKAFEATASFFNMKVFGFLPIYWFFLIPIFVAIITLLMRMIKH